MKEIHVQAQKDHIFSLCSSTAISAIAELIWNALDADAYDVKVDIIQNPLGAIDAVRIGDDGSGIDINDIDHNFGNLGGSWKRTTDRTREAGRVLHGCKGRGRFKAFSLGNCVEWRSTVRKENGLQSFVISGEASDPSRFTLTAQEKSGPATGTEVMITNIRGSLSSLRDTTGVLQQLSTYFALYLKAYPNVKIYFQGLLVNPVIVQKECQSYSLKSSTGATAELEIIEWKTRKNKARIIFCDPRGFALHEVDTGIRPGREFNFTAYLISPLFEELHRENLLVVEELHPEINAFLNAARDTLRAYFRTIREKKEHNIRYQWVEEDIYPFSRMDTEDKTQILFDNCARALQNYSNSFEDLSSAEKRLIFGLLKEALTADPKAAVNTLTKNLKIPATVKRQLR
ncbi:MAG: ATP-binding protein [Kiritimatiellia bacterium]